MADESKIGKEALWTPDSVCSESPEEAAAEETNDTEETIDVTNDEAEDAANEETDDEEETPESDEGEEKPKDEKPKEEKKETPVDYKSELEKAKADFEAYKSNEEARFKEFMNRNQHSPQAAANKETDFKSIFDDPAKQEEISNMYLERPAEFGKMVFNEAVNAVREMLRPTLEMANKLVVEEKTQNANKTIDAFKARYAESSLKGEVEKVLTDGSAEQKSVMELLNTGKYTLDEAFEKVYHKQIVEEEARKLAASRKGLSISTPQGRPVPQSEKDKPKPQGLENIIRAVLRGKLK